MIHWLQSLFKRNKKQRGFWHQAHTCVPKEQYLVLQRKVKTLESKLKKTKK